MKNRKQIYKFGDGDIIPSGIKTETQNPKPKAHQLKPGLFSLFLLFFSAVLNTYSQNFSYSISIDSTTQYSCLSGATVLSPNEKWQPAYEIPTGFTSPGSMQSVRLETNGFVIYNRSLNHAVMAFNGFHCKTDSVAALSQLSYLSTGTAGAKTLKIQFTNVGQSEDPKELLSYQVWIQENGVFQVVVGPNTYEAGAGNTLNDTTQVIHLGLINRDMDAATNGLLLSGTPQDPDPLTILAENPSLAYLRTVPKRGYHYVFTPANQN
jgi:hypothetical protein